MFGVWISVMASLVAAQPLIGPRHPIPDSAQYACDLPRGFPEPKIPRDNAMSRTKILLGRYLFYDKRLSLNATLSCADCHRQELAFTDGHAVPTGATGQMHSRSAMSLVNVAYNSTLTWSNPNLNSLEDQVLIPLFGDHPVELGMRGKEAALIELLRSDAVYSPLFQRSFPHESDPFKVSNLAKAIAAFERTILSARSPYDRFHFGDPQAISEAAQRGEVLFFSDPYSCFRCHSGFNFTDAAGALPKFHNTALYNVPGRFSYPGPNLGIFGYTTRPSDIGKFRTPTLRNIAVTGPYMHDGSVPTIEAAIDHYAAGGRTIPSGPNAGKGSENPNKDPRIKGFQLSQQNRDDLAAFLCSLTDDELLHDSRFSNPWKGTVQ
jgi:cytochrome c peroxidase